MNQLFTAEQFIVAVAPAQAGQVVDHGVGQKAFFVVLHYADCTVAFGKLFTIGPQNHRDVAVNGLLAAQCFQNIDLAWRVVDVVVATNDVGNVHFQVVDHHAKVVGGCAVLPGDNQIVHFFVVD